jgi:hypothetical protein
VGETVEATAMLDKSLNWKAFCGKMGVSNARKNEGLSRERSVRETAKGVGVAKIKYMNEQLKQR